MNKETIERLRVRASQHFLDSIAVKQEAEKTLPELVARGVMAMAEWWISGRCSTFCGRINWAI